MLHQYNKCSLSTLSELVLNHRYFVTEVELTNRWWGRGVSVRFHD